MLKSYKTCWLHRSERELALRNPQPFPSPLIKIVPLNRKRSRRKEKTREKPFFLWFYVLEHEYHALATIIRSSDWFWAHSEFGGSFSSRIEGLWGGAPLILFSSRSPLSSRRIERGFWVTSLRAATDPRIMKTTKDPKLTVNNRLPEPSLMLAFAIINYEIVCVETTTSRQRKRLVLVLGGAFLLAGNFFPASECLKCFFSLPLPYLVCFHLPKAISSLQFMASLLPSPCVLLLFFFLFFRVRCCRCRCSPSSTRRRLHVMVNDYSVC